MRKMTISEFIHAHKMPAHIVYKFANDKENSAGYFVIKDEHLYVKDDLKLRDKLMPIFHARNFMSINRNLASLAGSNNSIKSHEIIDSIQYHLRELEKHFKDQAVKQRQEKERVR